MLIHKLHKAGKPCKGEGKTEAHNATSLALPVNNTILKCKILLKKPAFRKKP